MQAETVDIDYLKTHLQYVHCMVDLINIVARGRGYFVVTKEFI